MKVFARTGGGVPAPPGGGFWLGGTRRFVLLDFILCCLFHPISLVLPKETGWSPKEKRFWVVAPP